MEEIKEFVRLTRYAGMREDLVQAGGGNSSVKLEDGQMLIKSSGYQMSEITESNGYSKVNQNVIIDFFESATDGDITTENEKKIIGNSLIEGKKPSIEVFLHSITRKYTLHTHPTLVNVLTARKNGFQVLRELFPGALFVDYATPGIKLAKKYFDTMKKQEEDTQLDIIFLKNHGIIVAADDAEIVIGTTDKVVQKIADYLNTDINGYLLATKLWNSIQVIDELKDKIVFLAKDENIGKILDITSGKMWDYEFCPDCMVYCGRKAMELGTDYKISDIQSHMEQYGVPTVCLLKGNVYLLADNVKKAMEIQSVLSFSAKVCELNKEQEMDLLTIEEQNFLLNWDAEKYRRNMK